MTELKLASGFVGVAAGALMIGAMAPGVAEAGGAKVGVCAKQGNGDYHLIDVSEKALQAQLRRGSTLPGQPHPDVPGAVFGPDCAPQLPAPVVEQGYSGLTEEGSVRFRQNNSGGEIYLGVADLGVGANRAESNFNWGDGVYEVEFSYDGVGTITTHVGGVSLDYPIAPSCGAWDTMDILVVDRSVATAIAFENVQLNGATLGNFGSFDLAGTHGFQNWTVSAFDFSQPWTLVGALAIENFSGSAELNKLQLTVGCLP
jgi:hypothetical protein